MSDILNHSEMEALVLLLTIGGGIIFLFGLVLPVSRSYAANMRGRRRPMPYLPVGVGLSTLGVVLGLSWNIL